MPTASSTSMLSVFAQFPGPRDEGVGFDVSAPTGQRSMMLPESSELSAFST